MTNKSKYQKKGNKVTKSTSKSQGIKPLGDVKGKYETRENHVPGHNDWTWYAPTDQVARDVASIPFNLVTGTVWDNAVKLINGASETPLHTAAPSVMTIDYALYAGGDVVAATDSINMAAKQLYTAIRKSNSGAKVYEATDVMLYVLAMREIYALYFQIKRLLGVVNAYSFMNRALPEGILNALGLTDHAIDDLRANLATYRGRLNLIAASINSFAIPKYFKVFMRDAYLSSYVFSDSTSLAGQFYVFRLRYTRSWSGTAYESGSALETHPLGKVDSVAELMDTLQDSIDALFYDTDVNTMAGDVVKAFPESDLYKLGETDADYVVIPGYDEDILNQINNMVWLSIDDQIQDASELDVYQENGLIHSGFVFDKVAPIANQYIPEKWLFNSHKDNPEYTDVLEWTRLYNVPVPQDPQGEKFTVLGGSELITFVSGNILNLNPDAPTRYETTPLYSLVSIAMDGQGFQNSIPQFAFISVFDWHPYMYVTLTLSGEPKFMSYSGDLKRCTFITDSMIQRIHNAAVYALFNTDRPFTMTR